MSVDISSVRQTGDNRFDVTITYTPEGALMQLDGKDYFFNVSALDEFGAKQSAMEQFRMKTHTGTKIKATNKMVLEKALVRYQENEEILKKARETNNYSKVQMCRGISWGRDKETGNLYHAYCEFCGRLFEDGATYKNSCEKYARKKGWIIGNTKETRDIAVCPLCKEKVKKEIEDVQ